MSQKNHSAPSNKKKYLTDIGTILIRKKGKKKFYTPQEVKAAHKENDWSLESEALGLVPDVISYALSAFCSREEFDAYHLSIGADYNYTEMKTVMLSEFTADNGSELTAIPGLDLDDSLLDLPEAADGVLGGFGDFIAALFE